MASPANRSTSSKEWPRQRTCSEIGALTESGRFSLPVARTFPLAEIAAAHRVSEYGHVRGKLVLVVGSPMRGSR
jgi:NADPH:quinone reductase-like Zn-dependent oxidoreductase